MPTNVFDKEQYSTDCAYLVNHFWKNIIFVGTFIIETYIYIHTILILPVSIYGDGILFMNKIANYYFDIEYRCRKHALLLLLTVAGHIPAVDCITKSTSTVASVLPSKSIVVVVGGWKPSRRPTVARCCHYYLSGLRILQ